MSTAQFDALMWVATTKKDLRHVIPITENQAHEKVPSQQGLPSGVVWQRNKRKWVDIFWAILFGVLYVVFIAICIIILSQAHIRFQSILSRNEVSEFYKDDVDSCCREVYNITGSLDVYTHSNFSLCHRKTETRRLRYTRGKFDGDEGIFQAFEKRPDIIIGHIIAKCIFSIVWIFFLRGFAKHTIFVIEWTKALLVLIILLSLIAFLES